jgi:hypothetical protein
MLNARREVVELDGRRRFFDLRHSWSNWIIGWITTFIVFHIALTFGIGTRHLDFTTHKWMVPLIVVENFLQIVGMGYIVVRFLYPGVPSEKGNAQPKCAANTTSSDD